MPVRILRVPTKILIVILVIVVVVGGILGMFFLGGGVPGLVRTVVAQRLPIAQVSQYTLDYSNPPLSTPLNGYITFHDAYYVPGTTELLLQVSSGYPNTRITFLSSSLNGDNPLTNCAGGTAIGGGGLLPGCYPKNVVIGTQPVWLISSTGNPCGLFVHNGTIILGMSRFDNATSLTSPVDPTKYKSGAEFQCANSISTQFLTIFPPYIDVSFGRIPDYEGLSDYYGCPGGYQVQWYSNTNVSMRICNVGTLPVTLTRYHIWYGSYSGYTSTGWSSQTIPVNQWRTVDIVTNSTYPMVPGHFYAVMFTTARYLVWSSDAISH